MKLRIKQKKLEFIWHLCNLNDDALAKEVLMIQKTLSMPGLVRECQEWIEEFSLPDIFKTKLTKLQWKNIVKKKIAQQNEKELKLKMMSLEKLKDSELMKEEFGVKPYVKNLTVPEARNIFKMRSSMMMNVKMNYMSDAKNVASMWLCNSCRTSIDSMGHVLWCPSYQHLRSDKDMKDDKDLASYLHSVILIREKLNTNN